MNTPDTRPVSARIATYAEAREAGEALLKLVEVNTPDTKADWLRSEIEKLEGEIKDEEWNEDGLSKNKKIVGYNTALTSIITRYKEELKVLESK